MSSLAFHTFGLMIDARNTHAVQGFTDRNPEAIAVAEASPGFISRAIALNRDPAVSRFDWDYGPWGPYALARFYTGGRAHAPTTPPLHSPCGKALGRFATSPTPENTGRPLRCASTGSSQRSGRPM